MTRKGRWKADRTVVGLGAVKKCISAPATEWAELDRVALLCQMSRSAFVRQAVKHFIVKVTL